MIQVYQIRVKLFTKKSIAYENVQSVLSNFIDSSFLQNENWKGFHREKGFKFYCFDSFYPFEKSKVYEAHKIYTLTIRTVKKDLADYWVTTLLNHENDQLKGLVTEIQIVPNRPIEKIYSLTPVIMKSEGYWKNKMTLGDYEKQLFINLVKKFNEVTGQKVDEDFEWCQMLEFNNQKPIAVKQKSIKLLGDKVTIHVASNQNAQDLSYFALGVGLGNNNARGSGFLNVKWM